MLQGIGYFNFLTNFDNVYLGFKLNGKTFPNTTAAMKYQIKHPDCFLFHKLNHTTSEPKNPPKKSSFRKNNRNNRKKNNISTTTTTTTSTEASMDISIDSSLMQLDNRVTHHPIRHHHGQRQGLRKRKLNKINEDKYYNTLK